MLQWYEENCKLFELEIEAMKRFYPDATYGFLPDKRMYWSVNVHPADKEWRLLCIYDCNHPSWKYGYSIKVYPEKPNCAEMIHMIESANVTPIHLPHILRDENDWMFFSLDTRTMMQNRSRWTLPTAAVMVNLAVRWINGFEEALMDQSAWSTFCQH